MPRLVSIHAVSTEFQKYLKCVLFWRAPAGRGPMSAATAGSVCLSEKLLLSAQAKGASPAHLLHHVRSRREELPQELLTGNYQMHNHSAKFN